MKSELQNFWLIGKLVTRSMWWLDIEFLLGFLLFLHLVIFNKVWFVLHGFSCNGTCLSWIEFIFDLSMWGYILVYLFKVIQYVMEAMVMVFLAYTLMWYWYRSWWLSWIDLGVYLDCCISVVLNEKLTCKY